MVENGRQRKTSESSQRHMAHYLQKNNCMNDGRFLMETHGGQQEVGNILQVLKEKNWQPRNP